MPFPRAVPLSDRAVLVVSGPDRTALLQGLVTNDVTKVSAKQAVWSALLTPQGKYLHDFFMVEGVVNDEPALLLDAEAKRIDDLKTRLSRYKLRSKVTLSVATDKTVYAVIGKGSAHVAGLSADPDDPGMPGAATLLPNNSVAFIDPRLSAMGVRIIGGAPDIKETGRPEDYDHRRLSLGLPNGSQDIEVEKGLLLESGFEELGGVDFSKGCYVGQELTARTRYRGLIKKRLMQVQVAGGIAPSPGTSLKTRDGKEAGTMRSAAPDGTDSAIGLAFLRLEHVQPDFPPLFTEDGTQIQPMLSDWMTLPEAPAPK